MSPTPIHYHRDHSSLLVSNLSLQQWETWLSPNTVPVLHHSLPGDRPSGFWIVSRWESTLSTRPPCLRAVAFSFIITDSTHFHCHSNQNFFLHLFQGGYSTHLQYLKNQNLLSVLGSHDILIDLLKMCPCSGSIFAVKSGFDKYIVSCNHYRVAQNSFTAPRSFLGFT